MTKNFDTIQRAVKSGRCGIFNDWHAHTGVTEEAFLEAIAWLLEDEEWRTDKWRTDKSKRLQREIQCRRNGSIRKLKRIYDPSGAFVGFYDVEDGVHVSGGAMLNADDSLEIFNPGNALRDARNLAGLSQRELAEASGVNFRTIQSYEQGYNDFRRIPLIDALRLSKALGCRVESFVPPDLQ